MKSLEAHHIHIPDSPSNEHPPQESDRSGKPHAPNPPEDLGTRHVSPPSQSPERIEGQLPDGHLLQDRYRVLGLLAVGGMSTVYKAQDLRFSQVTRLCVVKEMLHTTADPQVRTMMESRFEREANILASLNHPGIVQVYDFFSEGDRSYLIIEYVDGKNLDAILGDTEGFLSEAQVVNWAIQVCEVLSYLHSHDPEPIVFRDIKPSNIMLDSYSRVRLIDFGIAKVFEAGQKGTMIGTEGYTPPEQYRGSAEPRVDIYALGATMHHLLSKQDPKLEAPFSFHERPIHQTNPTVSRELADIINVQSCALFSVTDDLQHVVLEAGYPDLTGYHGVGKRFPISSEPAFELILNPGEPHEESTHEVITMSYLLVITPQKSALISKEVKRFADRHNINSILYVPLNVGQEITHFMTFDALDQRQRYTEEEIEIFLFLGRELMKAQRMERLDDILHDFKNPAIATAGFARRLKRLIEEEGPRDKESKIMRYLEILQEETSRLQEMAFSLYQVGKERVVDLTRVLRNRFDINREAIREQLKQNVTLEEGPFHYPLHVYCHPLHLERILDNLRNNATNAIPLRGGILSIQTYTDGSWAGAEITNTGLISEEERFKLLEGEGRGRGLYITHRIVRLLKGKIDVRVGRHNNPYRPPPFVPGKKS